MLLKNKHILVGISGGIAAYKVPELIRLLRKAGAEVRVTTTKNALQFVTPLTLQTVSNYPVYSDVFAPTNAHSTEHISLPDWADAMVIAPATANVIGKIAHGIADDALTTTFCAMRKPVVIAPAMNDKMYNNPATQNAIRELASWENVMMLDCAEGELACNSTGKGRMQEVDAIVEVIYWALSNKDMAGKEIMITAGPTQEALDPVRYISNYSTGKMGYAIAKECARRGAKVCLVSGPTNIEKPKAPILWEDNTYNVKEDALGTRDESVCKGSHTSECTKSTSKKANQGAIRVVDVRSAEEMWEACVKEFATKEITILCAAVADFTPETIADKKIKKVAGQEEYCLQLKTTHDIAASLGQKKDNEQLLVGFALETNNEEQHALQKMERKNLDMIVLNSLRDEGAGFGCDTNKVTIFARKKEDEQTLEQANGALEQNSAQVVAQTYPLLKKTEVARTIVEQIVGLRK